MKKNKFDKILKLVPKEYKYWINLEDQEKYIKAIKKIFKNKNDRMILDKYKYIGFPPICPNYKEIAKDYELNI